MTTTGNRLRKVAVVALGYDYLGNVQTTTATSYDYYDQAGNLKQSVDAYGNSIFDYYDHLNRQTSQTWTWGLGGADGSGGGSVSYGYDAESRMTMRQRHRHGRRNIPRRDSRLQLQL